MNREYYIFIVNYNIYDALGIHIYPENEFSNRENPICSSDMFPLTQREIMIRGIYAYKQSGLFDVIPKFKMTEREQLIADIFSKEKNIFTLITEEQVLLFISKKRLNKMYDDADAKLAEKRLKDINSGKKKTITHDELKEGV